MVESHAVNLFVVFFKKLFVFFCNLVLFFGVYKSLAYVILYQIKIFMFIVDFTQNSQFEQVFLWYLPSCSIWFLYSFTISGDIFSLFGSRTREWRKTVPKEQPRIFLITSIKFIKVRSSGQFWWLHDSVWIKFWPSLKQKYFFVFLYSTK